VDLALTVVDLRKKVDLALTVVDLRRRVDLVSVVVDLRKKADLVLVVVDLHRKVDLMLVVADLRKKADLVLVAVDLLRKVGMHGIIVATTSIIADIAASPQPLPGVLMTSGCLVRPGVFFASLRQWFKGGQFPRLLLPAGG